MSPKLPKARLQALFVTFLWSTSWILIKIGLTDIAALAGLRYGLAFLCLLPLVLHPQQRSVFKHLSLKDWLWLGLLGLIFYTITQGTQFAALAYLPSVTLSLLLNFSAVIVAFAGISLLHEKPTRQQWSGLGLFLGGVIIYFYPPTFPEGELLGLVIGLVSIVANAAAALMGRSINRQQRVSALVITTVSMGIGAAILLVTGLLTEGLPQLTLANWIILSWLAVVNTAFAFTLWNHTLRELSAVESSVINNTMLLQIALLAWLFLGEAINPLELLGMFTAAAGILLVQIGRKR